jgi:hypothetical protein
MAMRTLILATTILATAISVPAFARGGHGHGHHARMHGHSRNALSAPANPSVPPSLSPDGHVSEAPLPSSGRKPQAANPPALVSEKEKMDPEDAALDKRIKSICKGC